MEIHSAVMVVYINERGVGPTLRKGLSSRKKGTILRGRCSSQKHKKREKVAEIICFSSSDELPGRDRKTLDEAYERRLTFKLECPKLVIVLQALHKATDQRHDT